METRKIFEYALMKEKEGLEFFKSAAVRAQNSEAKSIFSKLIDEEIKHIKFIKEQIGSIKDGAEVSKQLATELNADNYFEKRAQKDLLEQTISESMVPDISILHFAYIIERDLSEFYAKSAQDAEGSAMEALLMLAEWEKSHEKFFKEIHDKLMEMYSNQPWGG